MAGPASSNRSDASGWTRREALLALLGAAAAACSQKRALRHVSPTSAPTTTSTTQVPSAGSAEPVPAPTVRVDQPGPPEVIFGGDPASGGFALTIDDGTCAGCAAEIVAAAQQTGFHLTICPNGTMGPTVWNAQAEAIAAMAATGQVSLCNHTWDHKDLTRLPAAEIKAELLRNEEWIQDRFGVSSRPFYRPPYGAHDPRVDDVAGELGWTKVILWNGSLGDSVLQPTSEILGQLRTYLRPGTIMLGHANHPPTASVIDEIITAVQNSGLRPMTLLELLGTQPDPGLARPDRPSLVRRPAAAQHGPKTVIARPVRARPRH